MVIFMVTVYIVRHCEALGNLTNKFQGQIDHDITETGAKQLEYLAKRFENEHIDAIYASPLIRAHKTALAVANVKGMSVELMDSLKEFHVGMFENMPFERFKTEFADYCERWRNSPWEFEAPNGEKMTEMYERIWQGVLDIVAKNSGKTVLVASHGCAIRNLLARVMYNDIKMLATVTIPKNTGVTKLIFNDDLSVTMEYCGDYSHLPAEGLVNVCGFEKTSGDKK